MLFIAIEIENTFNEMLMERDSKVLLQLIQRQSSLKMSPGLIGWALDLR